MTTFHLLTVLDWTTPVLEIVTVVVDVPSGMVIAAEPSNMNLAVIENNPGILINIKNTCNDIQHRKSKWKSYEFLLYCFC